MVRLSSSPWLPLWVAAGVALVVGGVRFLPVWTGVGPATLNHLELLTYDWRVRLGFDPTAPVATNLAAVFIDDDELRAVNKAFGFHWPWPRQLFGRVVRELAREGAERVAIDVFFLERHADFRETRMRMADGREVPSDAFFGEQLRAAGNVILGCPGEIVSNRWRVLAPIPELATNALALGYASADRDPDGVLRRVRPYRDDPQWGRIWHLGILLAAGRLDLDLDAARQEGDELVLPRRDGARPVRIPLDREGLFYVDWALRWNDPRLFKVAFTDVLAMDQYREAGETNIESALAGHLVVVGSLGTGSNISDVGATPLAAETYLVSLHWNVANSLLSGRFIRPPSMVLEAALILWMAAFAGWVTWRVRPVLSTVWIAAVAGGFIWLAVYAFLQQRVWLPLLSPLGGGLLLTHLATVTCRVVVERREQRRVRSLFSKVVAPDVVRELLAQPSIRLGGALRPVTVMFADVRGFTRMTDEQEQQARETIRRTGAEGAEAERILADHAGRTLASVNEVLAAVADRVKEYGGTLDKYIGDCVMAFWGAPVARGDQAAACVRAAIEAQRALDRINTRRREANEALRRRQKDPVLQGKRAELLPELALGIGIHSGVAIVGLVGSENHILNYTVFGREVNLASRLEGIAGRGWIVISEATFHRLQEEDPGLARQCEPLRRPPSRESLAKWSSTASVGKRGRSPPSLGPEGNRPGRSAHNMLRRSMSNRRRP